MICTPDRNCLRTRRNKRAPFGGESFTVATTKDGKRYFGFGADYVNPERVPGLSEDLVAELAWPSSEYERKWAREVACPACAAFDGASCQDVYGLAGTYDEYVAQSLGWGDGEGIVEEEVAKKEWLAVLEDALAGKIRSSKTSLNEHREIARRLGWLPPENAEAQKP